MFRCLHTRFLSSGVFTLDFLYSGALTNHIKFKLITIIHFISCRPKIITFKRNDDFFRICLKRRQDFASKIAFFMPQDAIATLITDCKCQPKILKQTLLTYQNGISMLRNHFLFEATEEVVQRLIPMGIIQHSFELHTWISLRPVIEVEGSEPNVLTMDDLEFGFVIYLATCGLSILGFLYEFIKFGLKAVFGSFAYRFLVVRIISVWMRTH